MNTIPERFSLVLAEANAAGVPVIAMDLGSCREVIKEGQTGFLVNGVNEAGRALERLSEIDRCALPPTGPAVFFHRDHGRGARTGLLYYLGPGSEEAVMKPDMIRRNSQNPILTKAQIP